MAPGHGNPSLRRRGGAGRAQQLKESGGAVLAQGAVPQIVFAGTDGAEKATREEPDWVGYGTGPARRTDESVGPLGSKRESDGAGGDEPGSLGARAAASLEHVTLRNLGLQAEPFGAGIG